MTVRPSTISCGRRCGRKLNTLEIKALAAGDQKIKEKMDLDNELQT